MKNTRKVRRVAAGVLAAAAIAVPAGATVTAAAAAVPVAGGCPTLLYHTNCGQ